MCFWRTQKVYDCRILFQHFQSTAYILAIMKSIFEYIDYRKYLHDYYEDKKKTTRHFSYRYFAQKSGITSPSFLKHVIDGKRNLTSAAIEKFITALKLKKKEASYFRNLVQFNQAKTSSEKQEHYAVLRSLFGTVQETVLRGKKYDYFQQWYNPIIRELICLHDFKDDYAALARSVVPAITEAQARKSLELLLDLKLVEETDTGYRQTSSALIADDAITSMAVRSFAEAMLGHAQKALHNVAKTERYISATTMGVSKATYDVLVAEIEAFKDRIKTIVNNDKNSTIVYHLNMELFPMSKEMGNRGEKA